MTGGGEPTPTSIEDLLAAIRQVDTGTRDEAFARHAELIKPPGSLGRLEDLGARLAAIAGRCPPPVPRSPAVVVAAADHGVHARGVSPWPQQITTRMVEMFCAGRGGVNAIARSVGARVAVLDVGCAIAPTDHPLLRSARVRAATADLCVAPAMSRTEAALALTAGASLATELVDDGVDLLVTGDMGIGNTTASACLTAVFAQQDAATVTGPGASAPAGGDPTGEGERSEPAGGDLPSLLAHKVAVVARGLERNGAGRDDPLGVLASLGGLEHAALVGVILAGAARGVPVLLDGAITNAAALAAVGVQPAAADYLIAAHRSPEPAAAIALAHLGLVPLFDLGLRLGEGTGGLLAVPLVQAAARTLAEMARLEELEPDT